MSKAYYMYIIFIRISLTYFYGGMRKSEMDETKCKNWN